MTKAPKIDRIALRGILRLRNDGGSREDALALALLFFRMKNRLIEAGLKR